MKKKELKAKKELKEVVPTPFEQYFNSLSTSDKKEIEDFFVGFNEHCLISKAVKKQLRTDFENAFLYYSKHSVSLKDALNYLDVKNLGGFYSRPPVVWFPLDDAAKIYPLSMEHNRMSIFRLSAYLKEDVIPEILQMALNFTIKRFPTFATTLKKGFFWHYLDTAKRRFDVTLEDDVPAQPMKIGMSGSQSFRVKYYHNRISVEFFHVLTDGIGGMEFLKSLVTEYFILLGVKVKKNDCYLDVNEEPNIEELENGFKKIPNTDSSSGFIDKISVQMNGRLSRIKPCRILHFKMNVNQLKMITKKYNATITSYLVALMFLAEKRATDEISGDITIQIPVSMRKYYPSKTLRNYSMYCNIRIPIPEISNFQDILANTIHQLNAKSSKEEMSKMVTSAKKMTSMYRFIPLRIKQPVARLVYGFLGDKIFSNTLSNIGVVNLPEEIASKIESMDFVLGTVITNRTACSLVTINDTTTFTITKMTTDPTFEERMYELLKKDGIDVEVEGSVNYES